MWGRTKRQGFDSFAGSLQEARRASTTGGGTALSTTAVVVGIIPKTTHLEVTFRNFATAVVGKLALNPYLLHLVSTNAGQGPQNITDFSDAGQGGTGVLLGAMATFANGGAYFIGSHVPFRGIAVVAGGTVNAVASVLTVEYWNGSVWTAVAGKSDGTAAAGATFGQTGNITFNVPTDWAATQLSSIAPRVPLSNAQIAPDQQRNTYFPQGAARPNYWLRLTVSAALTAGTILASAFSMNRSTAYAEYLENSLFASRVQGVPGGIAAVELLTDAGTANAIINCYTDSPTGVF
jgi:hypothetical protein